MRRPDSPRVGYVVKRYPRYSETFIVNEILAHEAAGYDIEIFALHPSSDTHFQDSISRVRAPVTFLPDRIERSTDFWSLLGQTITRRSGMAENLSECFAQDPCTVAQAAVLGDLAIKRGITHLHAHFANSATAVARLASKFSGVPYSLTAHAKDIFHESVDTDDLAKKFRDAHAVITVSEFNYEFLVNKFPSARHKIHRIYNGLDLTQFPFRSPEHRPPTIISVGRLVEKKGFEYLVDACVELRRRSVEFRCEIIGSGEIEAALRSRIEHYGLGSQVEMLGSRLQRKVIEHVQAAAVFAAPCVVGDDGNRDGLPTALLEAMALGTPCVGTDVTGIPEALLSERTGICVGQRDAMGLADQLERLLRNPDLRLRLATSARGHIERMFDVDRSAAAVRMLFANGRHNKQERRTA